MVQVMLPNLRGKEALREALKTATILKKKLGIKFNRDADDPYQALLAVLKGLDVVVEDYKRYRDVENLVKVVAEKKGEKVEDGVYVWPRHLKEAAEDVGVDWNELKNLLRDMEIIKYDRNVGKYKIKDL
jgi:hypothetical protein